MVVGEVTRKVWKCDRCSHEWLSRDGQKPVRCAKCKSPYWDRPANQKKREMVRNE